MCSYYWTPLSQECHAANLDSEISQVSSILPLVTSSSQFIPNSLFQCCFFCLYSAMFENGSFNLRCVFYFVSNSTSVFGCYAWKTTSSTTARRHCSRCTETNFQVVSKKTRVPQVSCVVPGRWEGLCNPELVVKSCLSKSEVMFFSFFFFFWWSSSLARTF